MYFFSQWEPTDAAGCRDAFIYEYVGDVVSNPSFIKRMRDYAEEGIKHFYFMMLQKDEVSVPVPPPSPPNEAPTVSSSPHLACRS